MEEKKNCWTSSRRCQSTAWAATDCNAEDCAKKIRLVDQKLRFRPLLKKYMTGLLSSLYLFTVLNCSPLEGSNTRREATRGKKCKQGQDTAKQALSLFFDWGEKIRNIMKLLKEVWFVLYFHLFKKIIKIDQRLDQQIIDQQVKSQIKSQANCTKLDQQIKS